MANGLFEDFNPLARVASNQHGPSVAKISRGTLIAFQYPMSYAKEPYSIHDPYPMVIVTDIWPTFVRGVNLHYLTFPYIKRILQGHCENRGFSYAAVKPDTYIAGAFRMYHRMGMRQVKRMDCSWLMDLLGAVRSFSESELQKLQEQIQAQIQARLQAKADELTSYEDFRNSLLKSQQQSFDNKVGEVRNVLTGGVNRDLVQEPMPTQLPPMPPTGGRPSGPNAPTGNAL